jgi:hypothetical protein
MAPMASLASDALLGREQELRAIDGLLDGIRDRGGSMLVRGEAGLGKSALLDEAEARATARGIAVLRTAGAPSEMQMAFSGLHRLLRSRFEKIDDLPGPQAAALRTAFGLGDGAAPDLFLIALAALDLLADAAADSPLLLIIEGRSLARPGYRRSAVVRRSAGWDGADRRALRGARRLREPA